MHLLEGLGLGGSAVLVGAADVRDVVAPQAAVARIDIAREHAACGVSSKRSERAGNLAEHVGVPIRLPR